MPIRTRNDARIAEYKWPASWYLLVPVVVHINLISVISDTQKILNVLEYHRH